MARTTNSKSSKYTNTYPDRVKARRRTRYDDEKSNNIEYYNKNKSDLDKASELEWTQFIGTGTDWAHIAPGLCLGGNYNTTVPGIAAVDVVIGPGSCNEISDAVNKSFSEIMSDIYARTSASELKFDQASLAMFITSTACISSSIAYLKRALKSTTFWVQRNIYYPRYIAAAMGFDYDDLVANKNSYVMQLNDLISQFNTFNIPDIFDVYKRQYSMFNNIYIDEDSDLAQIYLFKPVNYYFYDDTNNKASYREWNWNNNSIARYIQSATNSSPGAYTSFTTALTTVRGMIQAWKGSQDYYYITGTLGRAYKDMATVSIDGIKAEDTIDPQIDDVMMSQIMNATIVPNMYEADRGTGASVPLDITGDPVTGVVTWKPGAYACPVQQYGYLQGDSRFLRAFSDSPSGDDNVEMTRLIVPAVRLGGTGERAYVLRNSSPEIVASIYMARLPGVADLALYPNGQHNYIDMLFGKFQLNGYTDIVRPLQSAYINSNVVPIYYMIDNSIRPFINGTNGGVIPVNGWDTNCWTQGLNTIITAQAFRYTPLLLMVVFEGPTATNDYTDYDTAGQCLSITPIGDIYNFTVIGPKQLNDLQYVCLRSLYNTSQLTGSTLTFK